MIIEIHGLVIKCHSESTRLLEMLSIPFKYFIKDSGQPQVNIFIEETHPPYESFPQTIASFSTPRNVVFRSRDYKIIDYFGKGLILEENKWRKYTIYSRDRNFLQESFYLLVMSIFGQFCDQKGMLRIHALAFSHGDTAVIFSAQAGGGKSTMALRLLEKNHFKLISDDEAIVGKSGCVFPLPLRLGTLDRSKIKSIPEKYVYEISRMEFGKKYFIDIDHWSDRLESRHLEKKIFIIAHRLIGGEPYIERATRREAFRSLIGAAVLGLGLFQGMEFIFNNSPRELIWRLPILLRRFILAIKFCLGTESYQIYLSRDTEKNVRLLESFVVKLGQQKCREM